jgi:hypothetical protein
MKRIFKHLIFTIAFALMLLNNADARSAKALMAQLDLEGFNETQKAMIEEEIEIYSSEIDYLYESNKEEYKKKIHELFQKLAFGFKIYRLTSDNKVLEDSLDAFFGKTNLRAYVISYVEGAFLNNLFQRLAELKYKLKDNRSIEIKFKFRKVSEEGEEDIFNYEAQVLSTEEVKDTLRNALKRKLKEQNETEDALKNLYASVDGKNIAVFKNTSHAEISNKVDEILDRFDEYGLKDGPLLGYLDCRKFCNMCVAEKCAYLMMKQINQYGFGKYLIVEHDKKYIFTGTIKIDEENSLEIEKEFINEESYFKDYELYLEAWSVPYIYRALLDYPKTEWSDYIPWDGKNNNCFVHCTGKITENPPPAVKFLAEVLTSPYTAPGKIICGKNFIFEDEEVTSLDRGLAFLDVPGVGVITKSLAIKLGIKAMLVASIAKTLKYVDVLEAAIKSSKASKEAIDHAISVLKLVPETKQGAILKALQEGMPLEDVAKIAEQAASAAKLTWPELLELFKKAKLFETNVSKVLLSKFTRAKGYIVFNQVYLKDPITGLISVADNIIYNNKTNKWILNESKFGISNTLTKNQKAIEDAIKAGNPIELRTVDGLDLGNFGIIKQSSKLQFEGVIRSNSSTVEITSSIFEKIWGIVDMSVF